MTTMQAAVFVTLLFIALAIPFIVRSIVWSRFINQMKKEMHKKHFPFYSPKVTSFFLVNTIKTGTSFVFISHLEITKKSPGK